MTEKAKMTIELPKPLKKKFFERCEDMYVSPSTRTRMLISEDLKATEDIPAGFPKPKRRIVREVKNERN
jgi:hypothetical protein